MPRGWVTVPVFISSTFRDMQAERDHLVRFVFPRIRQELQERRLHFVDVDLRWGVTPEEDALSACMEIIDECRPRFICILGGRYGWIPPGGDESITAEEIRYAALDRPETEEYRFFYFRDSRATDDMERDLGSVAREPPGSDSERQLHELYREIQGVFEASTYPARWDSERSRLTGLETFGELVYRDIMASVDDEFGDAPPAALAEFERERAYMDRFIAGALRGFVPGSRVALMRALLAFPARDNPVRVVVGESGSGKSALLAALGSQAAEADPDRPVITHFVEASDRSSDLRWTLRRLSHEVGAVSGVESKIPRDIPGLIRAFRSALEAVERPLLLIVDGIDQLDPSGGAHEMAWLPRRLGPHVRVIVSTAEHAALRALVARGPDVVEVRKLDELGPEDVAAIAERFMHVYRKRLTPAQLDALLAKPEAGSPLYLSGALEELRTMGVYEERPTRVERLPGTIAELFDWVLRGRLSDEVGTELVSEVVTLLAASRFGLRDSDLVAIAEPNGSEGNLPALLRLLRPYLAQRGELTDFRNRRLREAVAAGEMSDAPRLRAAHEKLADHFERFSLDEDRLAHSERPYHLQEAEEWEELYWHARAEGFLEWQVKVTEDESTALRTIQGAIRGAIAEGKPALLAEFILRHAGRLQARGRETPTKALSKGGAHRAWELADGLEAEDRVLWHLLLARELHDDGRADEAYATLRRLAEGQLVRLAGWTAECAVVLLAHAADVDQKMVVALAVGLLENVARGSLGRQLAARGHFTACSIVAEQIVYSELRSELLAYLACKQAEAGVVSADAALATAEGVADEETRAECLMNLSAILGEAGARDPARAALAAAVDAAAGHSYLLDRLVEYMAPRDAELAIEAARMADVPGHRCALLIGVAEHSLSAGALDVAEEAFRLAKAEAESVPHPYWRNVELAGAMARMGAAWLSRGDTREAVGLLDAALELSQSLTPTERRPVVELVCHSQIEAGELEFAAVTARGTPWCPDLAGDVAVALARRGDVDTSSELIREMRAEPELRVLTLVETVKALAEAGERDAAGAALDAARVTALRTSWPRRDGFIGQVAVAAEAVGDHRTVRFMLDEIEDEHERDLAVQELALDMTRRRRFSDGLTRVYGIKDLEVRDRALGAIAELRTDAGQFVEARDVAERMSRDRDEVLAKIAAAQTTAGHPVAAANTTKKMLASDARAAARLEIALAQERAGDPAGARKTLALALQSALPPDWEALWSRAFYRIGPGYLRLRRPGCLDALDRDSSDRRPPDREPCIPRELLEVVAGLAADGVGAADPERLAESHLALQGWVENVVGLAEARAANGERDVALGLLELASGLAWTGFEYPGSDAIRDAIETVRAPLGDRGEPTSISSWTWIRDLAWLAGSRASSGERDAAATLLVLAEALARPDPLALVVVAEGRARAGDPQGALATARGIDEDSPARREALRKISRIQAERVEFADALQAAHSIDEDSARSSALADIAELQVRAGLGADAVETAQAITSGRDRHLTRVAAALAVAKDTENFSEMLIPCAHYPQAAFDVCALLAVVDHNSEHALVEAVMKADTYERRYEHGP